MICISFLNLLDFSLMDRAGDGAGRRAVLAARLIDHAAVCPGYCGFSITGNIDIQSKFLFLRNFLWLKLILRLCYKGDARGESRWAPLAVLCYLPARLGSRRLFRTEYTPGR